MADEHHTATTEEAQVEERPFQTEVQQVLQILIHSLYTDKDVFLRELVSNASDALDKIRFRSLTDRDIVNPDAELEIDISVDTNAKTLTIRDSGIGMTRDEVNDNIGTIAHSGSKEFLQQLSEEKDEESRVRLIGQFGVGFYSVFMVAERVVVTTRSATSEDEAVIWESTGDGSYTISTTKDKTDRGTEIKIYVRSDTEEYLDAHRLESVVRRHSDFVSYPIKVAGKQANSASALWTRPRNEITPENYQEFYQHLSGDHQEPLAWEHVVVDVPIQFYAVLFLPRQSPMELLFGQDPKVHINMHVKRVFIQDDCELLPLYLRFVRGVVDCDDLPLNVARESLQNNPVVAKIRQTLTRRILSKIEDLATKEPTSFLTFWESFGIVLKEGVARDFEHREQVSKLLRFFSSFSSKLAADAPKPTEDGDDADSADKATPEKRTTETEGLVALQDYVDRMKSDQEVIYYVTGDSRQQVEQSPLMEPFRKHDLEVLYLTDPVDEWVVSSLQDFDGKRFQAIDAEDLELPEEVKLEGVESTDDKERTIELVSYLKRELESRVGEVKESSRLSDSPCALVVPKGGLSQQMERLMRMSDESFPLTKRTLEVNPSHLAIRNMGELLKVDRESAELKEWAHFLVDYVLLAEGKVEEPQRVMSQIQKMMSAVSAQALQARE
ncbi:MAG: molecular chaperone HtpG [Candidatus Latescibacterota bacterium]|nr:molecular chaperone HtpG [Candidatus Latescibacterota bacterium]